MQKIILFFSKIGSFVMAILQKISQWWDEKHPFPYEEIEFSEPSEIAHESEWKISTMRKSVIFWGIGLLFVMIGAILYHTLDYVFMLLFAFITSLALESIIGFWARLTHSRWLWILIAYFLAILFLLSWFFILVPFLFDWWTQLLQALITFFQTVQWEILDQGFDMYIRSISWLPASLWEEIIEYVKDSDSISILPTLTENIGKIINLSSSYLKFIWEYAVNFFWAFLGMMGNLMIFFTLAIFFSLSHFRVKQVLKYFFRNLDTAKQKIDTIYRTVANRLKSQLLLCCFVGCSVYFWLQILSFIWYDIPQKWILAILSGLVDIIPYFWPCLWLLPAAIFGCIYCGFPWLLAVVILYLLIQQSEEKIVAPYIMNKTLWVSPLLILICMLLAGALMGFFGIVFAVPFSIIVSTIFSLPEPVKIIEKSKKKGFWWFQKKKES